MCNTLDAKNRTVPGILQSNPIQVRVSQITSLEFKEEPNKGIG